MKYIDLHTHSNYSDGTCSPAEVVEKAVSNGLSAFALTDHDSVAGIDDAINAVKKQNAPIQLIPGTELSVGYKSGDIHIVGLFINHHDAAFNKVSEMMIKRRIDRNLEMVKRFNDAGIPITIPELTNGNPDAVITRAHFARWLVDHDVVKSPNDAFKKYLDTSSPFYVPRKYITPEEGIDIINKSGGIAILAHPLHYKLPQNELEQLIERLKDAGLKGIEVMYSNHIGQDEAYARKLANKYHLLPSGGSDFHGANKPAIDIGKGRGNLAIPYEYLENLAAECNIDLSDYNI